MRDPYGRREESQWWLPVTVDLQAEATAAMLSAGVVSPRARRALTLEAAKASPDLIARAWHGVLCELSGMSEEEEASDWRRLVEGARARYDAGQWWGHLEAPREMQ